MGFRDIQCTTWYLKKTRLRTWGRFSVVVQVDEEGPRAKRPEQGWTGWILGSRDVKLMIQDFELYPGDVREGMVGSWGRIVGGLPGKIGGSGGGQGHHDGYEEQEQVHGP